MNRIRCNQDQIEQTRLFCENNNLNFSNKPGSSDFLFYTLEEACMVSNFLFRIDELDKMDKIKELEVYPLGLN